MIEAQKITFRWGPRPESAGELGKRLFDALKWAAEVGALEGSWTTTKGRPGQVKRPEIVPCASPEALEGALVEGSTRPRPDASVSMIEAAAFLGTFRKHKASLQLLCFPEERSDPYPNRAILTLYEPLDAEHLRKLFVGWIGVFRPAYGWASLARRPPSGKPPHAGWLTFLGPTFPAPGALPGEVILSSLGPLGAVLQLSPKLMTFAEPGERAALQALQAALRG